MASLGQMVTSSLRESDLLGGQVERAEVVYMLNEELAGLHELQVHAHEGWSLTGSAMTVSTTGSVALPSTFWRAVDVHDMSSGDDGDPLPTFEFKDRSRVGRKSYCVHGNELLVRPLSDAAGTYTLKYVPKYTDLVADAETYDVPNHWELYAVLKVAIRLRTMQEESTSNHEQRLEDVTRRIMDAAVKRKGPRKVRDVRRLRREEPDLDDGSS